ncbi:MAG: DUF1890 domain-containing protein [Methanomicrobiales archaeon]|nr:DUF1890 domain-containing protein [Methanomicrobiales archaeon]
MGIGREGSDTGARRAVLVLGCPQVPVQTSIALYLAHVLRLRGLGVSVAGNRAARHLIQVADPEGRYVRESIDIDTYFSQLAGGERDYAFAFVFIHNDSGLVYAASVHAMTQGVVIPVVYGEHYEEMAGQVSYARETIMANAVHNPMPLKHRIDEVIPWVVSNL